MKQGKGDFFINLIISIVRWILVAAFNLVKGITLMFLEFLVRLLPIAAIIGGLIWYDGADDRERDKVVAVFDGLVEESLAQRRDIQNLPVVSGKVLPVNLSANEVDQDLFFSLSDTIRPTSVDEVSWLLGINCNDQVIGTYTDGADGLQKHCDAHLINPETFEWSYLGAFVGTDPPETKSGGGDRSGSRPTRDIMNKVDELRST